MTLVTVSASYGAGGSQIGPQLAERLGVEFIDRAIPVAVAERLEVPLADAISQEHPVGGVLDRLLASFAPVGSIYGTPLEIGQPLGERAYASATEQVIRERAAAGSAVILGRAGALVLEADPRALHVRLDGPKGSRLARAMERDGIDRDTACRRLEQTDRARETYVHQFYGRDARDPALYHLVLDSTRFELETCIELVLLAAGALIPGESWRPAR